MVKLFFNVVLILKTTTLTTKQKTTQILLKLPTIEMEMYYPRVVT